MATTDPDSINSILLEEIQPGVFGGYKRSWIHENLSERDEHFTLCYKCKGLMRNACVIEQANKLSCESCTGGSAYSVFTIGRKSISDIHLRCPLSKRGCTWVGKSESAEIHLQNCEFFRLACPLNCSDTMLRCETEDHVKNVCPNRLMLCDYCQSFIEICREAVHLEKCSEYQIECVNGCGSKVKRRELASHLDTSCILSDVSCVFAEIGCGSIGIARKDMKTHEELFQSYHMALITNANSDQKKLIDSLRVELEMERESKEELKEEVLNQKNEIAQLTNESDCFRKELDEVKAGLLGLRARVPEEHGCCFEKEISMTLKDLKIMGLTGDGATITEIKMERYELDCYARAENSDLSFYLRSWDGAKDDQLIWPFSAECIVRIIPNKEGASQLVHKPVRVQLERVPREEKTFLELSRDLHKVESQSSKLIGMFPLSIVLGERYNKKDSLKLGLTLKCYNLV